jgi:hypothetical protein
MSLVVYSKRGFLGSHYPGLAVGNAILRLSGEVRGAQIAEALGVPLNPIPRPPETTAVLVKGYRRQWAHAGDWLDWADSTWEAVGAWAAAHPEVGLLAHTTHAEAWLRARLPHHDIRHVPQQHLNWEGNEHRPPGRTLVAGYIGRPSPIACRLVAEEEALLRPLGVPMIAAWSWETRRDAIRFYQTIDVLVIGGYGVLPADTWQATPTKMINAGAFGVPAIAAPRAGYADWEGCYWPYRTADDLRDALTALSDPAVYAVWSWRVRRAAEPYHITRICERYRALDRQAVAA